MKMDLSMLGRVSITAISRITIIGISSSFSKIKMNLTSVLHYYFFKNRELEDAVNRLAGKSLIRYTYEDKKAEKEDNKAAIRLLLKFFLIVIGVLLLIAVFSFYYARIEH